MGWNCPVAKYDQCMQEYEVNENNMLIVNMTDWKIEMETESKGKKKLEKRVYYIPYVKNGRMILTVNGKLVLVAVNKNNAQSVVI